MNKAKVLAAYRREFERRRGEPRGHVDLDRILLVGQGPRDPARHGSTRPLFPFPGNSTGARLVKLSGMTLDQRFSMDAVNSTDDWTGKVGKGDHYDPRMQVVEGLMERTRMRERTVVFVGKATARAFPWDPPTSPCVWQGRWAWIHHTSGIVTHWNDPKNVYRLRRFFADLLS